jgi:DNA-binding PadR family transcriptional regulator
MRSDDPERAGRDRPTAFGPPGSPSLGRRSRGNLRAAIRALLAERSMHGYEMIRELTARTQGVWRPSPGSIYPALRRLEGEGFITSQEQDGKRLFSLTDAGRAEAEREPFRPSPWEEVNDSIAPAMLQLRDAMALIGVAVADVIRAGTEGQQMRAWDVLTETRRRLYAILADHE